MSIATPQTTTTPARLSLNLDKSTWSRVRFGEVVNNANGKVKDPEVEDVDRTIAMEHLDPGEITIQRWGSLEDGTTFSRHVKPGQTLFGKRRAYQRKAAFAEFEAVCSGDILTFEAIQGRLLPEFLPFLVQSDGFYDHALGTSAGSLSPRTNWRDLKGYEFALPALDEQKRLADLLWALERHRRSINDAAAKSPAACDIWLENRLAPYDSVALHQTMTLQHGRPVKSKLYRQGSFPLLRPGDMSPNGSVEWTDSSVGIPESFATANSDWILKPGDLVINMTAQSLEDRFLGRVCQIDSQAFLNQRIGRLEPVEEMLRDFAFVALRSRQFTDWVSRHAEGSKVKHMHWRHIANYPLPFPDPDVQSSIVAEARSWSSMETTHRQVSEDIALLRAALLAEIFEEGE